MLEQHHCLGEAHKTGQTQRYVAQYGGTWAELLSFPASSFKCAARNQWIGRKVTDKKSGGERSEAALGVTRRAPDQAALADLLRINSGHWSVENSCQYARDMTWNHGTKTAAVSATAATPKHLTPAPLRHQRAQPARPAW